MHRTDARMLGKLAFVLAAVAAAFALSGCAGSTRIDGRVVSGPVGLAVVVDQTDERLAEPGVPGVEIALLQESSTAGGAVIATTTSDEDGNFRITLARGRHPGGQIVVRARGDAIYTARSRAYLPRGGQRLLCTVMPRPASQSRADEPRDAPGTMNSER